MVTVRADGALVVRSPDRSTVVSPMAPECPAPVGAWVLVHAGFALQVVDEQDVWPVARPADGARPGGEQSHDE